MSSPIVIKIDNDFEKQNKHNVYELDFSKSNYYRIEFTDGYYVDIIDKVTHVENDDLVEAILYTKNNEPKSYNWANSRADEVQYILYNWIMNLTIHKNNIYQLIFERGKEVGGGFL